MKKTYITAIKKDVNNPSPAGETPAQGVSVTIKTDQGALANIYSDNNKTIKANPITTDSNGQAWFYAENGIYTYEYDLPSGTRIEEDNLIFDPDDQKGIDLQALNNPLCEVNFGVNGITGSYAGDISFTRAGEATYFDIYGNLQIAAANELRIEKEGALIEGTSTNEAVYSNDFTQAQWRKTNSSVTPNVTISPDGNLNACEVFATIVSGFLLQPLTSFTNGDAFTASLFVKKSTSSSLAIASKLGNGTFATLKYFFDTKVFEPNANITECEVEDCADGWVRISFSASDAEDIRIFPSGLNDGTNSSFIYGCQVEKKIHPTSYISTTTAPATRPADLLDIQFANNHPLFKSSLTMVMDCLYGFNVNGNSDSCTIFDISNNIDANLVYDKAAQELTSKYFVAGSSVSAIDSSSYPVELTCGRVVDWGSKTHKSFCNGVYGNVQDITNGIPVNVNGATNINLGRDQYNAGSHARIHIKSLKIYDKALTSNQLSFLTGY